MEVIDQPALLREQDADEPEEMEIEEHQCKRVRTTGLQDQDATTVTPPSALPCPPLAELEIFAEAGKPTAPGTPKKRKRAEPGDAGGDGTSVTPTRKQLTPEERAAQRVQKEQEKLKKAEEKKRREEERELKKKELEEKKAQKELEKAKRDAEREEKKRLKEEEKQKKEEERKKREDDKRKKEEDKLKKEEEKKKREEEKRKKDEEKKQRADERSKAKQKLAEKQKSILTTFLKKAPAPEAKPVVNKTEDDGNPFHALFKGVDIPPNTVRSSYLPSPVPGIVRLEAHEIDAALASAADRCPSVTSWQVEMRNRKLLRKAHETAVAEERQRQRQRESQTADESGAEVIVYDPVGSHVHSTRRRMKFFKFHENNRPAYFGTYSKRSHCISPRNPFKQDTLLLDYECDSDDDWEDEGEGESLADSEEEEEDDEEEVSGESDDEEDGFMVPDGYLSEDEGVEDDSDDEGIALSDKGKEKVLVDGAEPEGGDGNKEKERRRRWKEKQSEKGKNGKIAKLRTVAVGPVFYTRSTDVPLQYSALFADFEIRVMVDLSNGPIDPEATLTKEKAETKESSMPDVVLRDLIRSTHGSTLGMKKVVGQFYDKYVTEPSLQRYSLTKNGLIKKIREIAVREKRTDDIKARWHVAETVIQSLNMEDECAQLLAAKRQKATSSTSTSTTPRKKSAGRPSLGAVTPADSTPAAGSQLPVPLMFEARCPDSTAAACPPASAPAPALDGLSTPPATLESKSKSASGTEHSPAVRVLTPRRKSTKDIKLFFSPAAASSPAPAKAAAAISSVPSPTFESDEERSLPTMSSPSTTSAPVTETPSASSPDPLLPGFD